MNITESLMIEKLLQHEGGYANNPFDKGGETYRGISRNNHSYWTGWFVLDNEMNKNSNKLKERLDLEVKTFYYEKYYLAFRLNEIHNFDVRGLIFDFCVNSGQRNTFRTVQRLLNEKYNAGLIVDGFNGYNTMQAINRVSNQSQLNNEIVDARISFYHNIVRNDSSQSIFLNGWLRRAKSHYVSLQHTSFTQLIIDFFKNIISQLLKK